MENVLAMVIGGLYAVGVYLLLRRSAMRLVIGFGLIGHANNLLIFACGGLERAWPPILGADGVPAAAQVANPLPQAFILTAIVIGFALQAFSLVLVYRTSQAAATGDLDALTTTER
jgi:multicomponent Na+:H+ antiporter subunit C